MSIVRTATLLPQLTSPDKTYGLAEASIYMYVPSVDVLPYPLPTPH
jgi:hypothetical protein